MIRHAYSTIWLPPFTEIQHTTSHPHNFKIVTWNLFFLARLKNQFVFCAPNLVQVRHIRTSREKRSKIKPSEGGFQCTFQGRYLERKSQISLCCKKNSPSSIFGKGKLDLDFSPTFYGDSKHASPFNCRLDTPSQFHASPFFVCCKQGRNFRAFKNIFAGERASSAAVKRLEIYRPSASPDS